MDDLEVIWQRFDESYSHAIDVDFHKLQSCLMRTREDLLERFKGNDFARLEIRRAELERLLIGGIDRRLGVSECIEIYSARRTLGFDGVVDHWLIAQVLIRYCFEEPPKCRAPIVDMCRSIEVSLEETIAACRESLVQLRSLQRKD